ncbi:hypothetical protein ANANG_G00024500 [Anguilla anguilla]|uniref:Cysteine-rich protein 2 n=1 Tax=Anguilla anguilla TaxID=7936 RepID=A0A9D3N2W7_ANGAN|nr:hypothetical protein ANANG_G00024500 [Anguilla anguilla]
MASKCPKCDKTVYFAEKVTSLGKDWHKFCLKCARCNKTLTAGGHAEHDGQPYCHKPCYATLYGPKGVNIGGGLLHLRAPRQQRARQRPRGNQLQTRGEEGVRPAQGSRERCNKKVYFAEKVTSLGKDWHRPCLRCERCNKTLAPGSHAEHDGQPYCHKPCYAVLFGPKGVNTGGVGSYIYDKMPSTETQP